MRLIVTRLDIPRTRAAWTDTEFNPAYVAPRQKGDNTAWHVADSVIPVSAKDANLKWASAATDEYIRIPLFSYEIVPQGDLALAFMFQLGMAAASAFKENVSVLHMVTGNPVELVSATNGPPTSMTYWFGFAVA
jgi:hypothetical protein